MGPCFRPCQQSTLWLHVSLIQQVLSVQWALCTGVFRSIWNWCLCQSIRPCIFLIRCNLLLRVKGSCVFFGLKRKVISKPVVQHRTCFSACDPASTFPYLYFYCFNCCTLTNNQSTWTCKTISTLLVHEDQRRSARDVLLKSLWKCSTFFWLQCFICIYKKSGSNKSLVLPNFLLRSSSLSLDPVGPNRYEPIKIFRSYWKAELDYIWLCLLNNMSIFCWKKKTSGRATLRIVLFYIEVYCDNSVVCFLTLGAIFIILVHCGSSMVYAALILRSIIELMYWSDASV